MRKLIGFGILAVALIFVAPGCDKKAEEKAAPAEAEKKEDKKEAPEAKKKEAKKEAPKAEKKKVAAKPAAGGGECDKYVACCKGIVAKNPAAKAGCDTMEKSIAAAASNDAAKAGMEAGCKTARAAMSKMPDAPAACK